MQRHFHVTSLNREKIDGTNKNLLADNMEMLASAVYLQVSTISQALIFVTRSRGWSFMERPGLLLMGAFVIAQLVSSPALVCISKFYFKKCNPGRDVLLLLLQQQLLLNI